MNKGDVPSGKKYGRSPPGEINIDIISPIINEEYHPVPEGYGFLDFPLKPDVIPIKDYILVSQEFWDFFYDLYGGTILKRYSN